MVDGVNVTSLRALDDCLLRGEKAFVKANAGKSLTEEEEKDLYDFYHKLQLVAQVKGVNTDCSKSESSVVKKNGTK